MTEYKAQDTDIVFAAANGAGHLQMPDRRRDHLSGHQSGGANCHLDSHNRPKELQSGV